MHLVLLKYGTREDFLKKHGDARVHKPMIYQISDFYTISAYFINDMKRRTFFLKCSVQN